MSSSGLQTSSGEWSEWGNNGNNGGWNTGGSGTFKPHEPTGITKSKTASNTFKDIVVELLLSYGHPSCSAIWTLADVQYQLGYLHKKSLA